MYLARPKFWFGAEPWALARAFAGSGWKISLMRLPALVAGVLLSVVNGGFALLTHLVFARHIARVEITHGPIFILGHWRSGTTLLHELMSIDQRFATPTGYQCFAPGHFLLTEAALACGLQVLMPRKRPMDEMKLDLMAPQEDEFAMINRIGVSCYREFLSFPKAIDDDNLLVRASGDHASDRLWRRTWMWFLKSVLLKAGPDKCLLLKSPHHTARISTILKCFPNARFIHISREPSTMLASTRRTWRAMINSQALHRADQFGDDIDHRISMRFQAMYDAYFADSSSLPSGQLVEVQYEDLTARPKETLAFIYRALKISDFDTKVAPYLAVELLARSQHKSRTEVTADDASFADRQQLTSQYAERFGYAVPIPQARPASNRADKHAAA